MLFIEEMLQKTCAISLMCYLGVLPTQNDKNIWKWCIASKRSYFEGNSV